MRWRFLLAKTKKSMQQFDEIVEEICYLSVIEKFLSNLIKYFNMSFTIYMNLYKKSSLKKSFGAEIKYGIGIWLEINYEVLKYILKNKNS